ncbi:MAG: hypothetical protein SF029_20775 [bacterium]|nr:hypothetical protein [bacterium]
MKRLLVFAGMASALFLFTMPTVAQETPEATVPAEAQPAPLADAISASFIVQDLSPLVGEPVTLILQIETPPDVTLVEWPYIPESWEALSIHDMQPTESEVLVDDRRVQRQRMIVRAWRPGEHVTPNLFFGYRVMGDSTIYRLAVRPFTLNVESILIPGDTTLRDFKPQIGFFYLPLWAFLALGGGMLVFGYAGWQRWQQWQTRRAFVPAGFSPIEIAQQGLTALAAEGHPPSVVFAEVADILRDVLAARFDLTTREWTTPEVINALRTQRVLNEASLNQLAALLDQTDLVKFANLRPQRTAAGRVINAAQQWLESLEPATQQRLSQESAA